MKFESQLQITTAAGLAPLTVNQTQLVINLNADLLDGQHGSYYQDAGNLNAGTVPSARLSGSYNINITGQIIRSTGVIADVLAPGSGTYNKHEIYANATEFAVEGALATDVSTGTRLPIYLTWRGGYVAQGGFKLTGASSAELGGSAILHASNYSSYALPLSGGTLTGGLTGTTATFSGNVKGGRVTLRDDCLEQHVDDSDSVGVFVNYFGYASGTTRFRNFGVFNGKNQQLFYITGSTGAASITGTLSVTGAITQNGNQVLHVGNYTSYAQPIGTNLPYSWTNTADIKVFTGAYSYNTGVAKYLLLWQRTSGATGTNGRFVDGMLKVWRGANHAGNGGTVGYIHASSGYSGTSSEVLVYTPFTGQALSFFSVIYNSVEWVAISLPISDYRWELRGHYGIQSDTTTVPIQIQANDAGVGTITALTTTSYLLHTGTTSAPNLSIGGSAAQLNGQAASYYENRDTTAVGFSSGTLTLTRAAGNLTVSLDGRYLPLTGGTVSGVVRINNQLQVGQNTNGTAYIDAYGGYAWFGRDSNSTGIRIDGSANVHMTNTLNVVNAITQNGNQVLHAGNYGGYSTFSGTVTGSSFSGAGTGLTGTAASLTAGAVPWSGVTGKPTTLSGYGITDAMYQVDPNGFTQGDINGSGNMQRLWGTDSVQNLIAFRPPTTVEYTTDGVNWTATTISSDVFDGKVFGKWGGFNMNVGSNIGAWTKVRMTWVNFGYHFFSHFTMAHSTNGHSMNFVFYKSDLNGVFGAEAYRVNGISSWPGYTFTSHVNVSGWWDTRDVRMVFELIGNNGPSGYPNNAISIGHIGIMGGYSSFNRVFDWDASRNITLYGNLTLPGNVSATGTVSGSSFSGAGTNLTGTANSLNVGGSAARWATGRTIALTGDVTATSGTFDGTANLSFAATIANSAVTYAKIQNVAVSSVLGNSSASVAQAPAALSMATLAGMLSGQTMNIAGSSTSCTGNAATATNVAWSGITSKPTTLSGFGITDALPLSGGTLSGNLSISGALTYYQVSDGTNSLRIGLWDNSNIRLEGGGRPMYMVSYGGTISIGRSSGTNLVIDTSSIAWGGNALLHAGNYSSYALPLSGGTLSGLLIANNGIDVNAAATGRIRWRAAGQGTTSLNLPFYHNSSYGSINIEVSDNDTGGLMIDNEGVTVYGAGDNGQVFRVIDEDVYQATTNITASTTFWVNQLQNGGGGILGPFTISGNTALHAGNYTSYTLPRGGSWYGVSLPGSRWGGFSANGGEIVFGQDLPNTGQMGVLIDGCYIAGENNGFWSLASSNDWTTRRGMYFDGTYLRFDYNSATAYFSNASINGNQVIHAGNYSSYALPLTGGTLSGNLTINGTLLVAPGVIAVNSLTDGYIGMGDPTHTVGWGVSQGIAGRTGDCIWAFGSNGSTGNNDTWYFGIGSAANTTFGTAFSITQNRKVNFQNGVDVVYGALTQGGNQVLHAGNYTSYRGNQLLSPNGGTVVAADSAMPDAANSFIHTLGFGPSGNDGHILGMTWTGTSVYGAQIWIDTDPTNRMAFRSRSNAGVWTGWNEIIHSSNYSSYALPLSGGTLTGALSGTSASFSGALSSGGNSVLTVGNYSSYAVDNTKRIKQFFWDTLSASATQARRFEIARIGIDIVNWNQVGTFEIELCEQYWSNGLKKKYIVSYGYSGTRPLLKLVDMSGAGSNNFQVVLGSEQPVSGNQYYLPIYVDVRYYAYVDVRVTTSRLITSNSTPPVGYTYINTAPTPTNITDFSADSTVDISNAATAWLVGGNTILTSATTSAPNLSIGGNAAGLNNGSRQLSAGGASNWIAWKSTSADSGASAIALYGSTGSWFGMLYGDSGGTGFLNTSNGWDLRKSINGELYATVSGTAQTVIHSGNYTSYLNNTYLRAAGHPGYGNWDTFGNTAQTVHQMYQENFNLPTSTGSSNFPTNASYKYGALINFASGNDARAQVYISHAGNDLVFRGGWGTGGWQTWNRCLTDQNYSNYALPLSGGTVTGTLAINGGDCLRVFKGGASSVTSHIYWANTGNTIAYNWQLDENNNAAMWGYGGTAWAKLLTVTAAGALTAASSITASSFSGAGTGLTGTAASLTAGAVPWSGITSKPTTFNGYGISDIAYGSTGSRNVWTITDWNQTTYQNAHFLSSENTHTNGPSSDFIYGLQTSFHRSGAAYRTQMVTELYSSPVSIWVRNSRDSDVWTTWSKLLHSNNYNSYVLSASGTAASLSIGGSAGSVPASGITGQTGMWTSATRPGPYRLYRRDNDSNYSVQTYWTGSYWRLYGYSGDTAHADTHVGYADSAGSVSTIADGAVSTTAKLANSVVTYAKIQNVGASSVLGNTSASVSQAPQEITFANLGPYINGVARAWATFSENPSTGAITINASFGISSVTRLALGVYQINFSSAFADANYAVSGTIGYESISAYTNGGYLALTRTATPKATTSCEVCASYGGTNYNARYVHVVFHR